MDMNRYESGGENTRGDRQTLVEGLRYEFSRGVPFAKDVELIKRIQLYDVWLWKTFVEQFRHRGVDDERYAGVPNGWRGEYWGKLMRGASLVCSWSEDETLRSLLTESVKDMLSTEGKGGFSTYSEERELYGWDLWCRKYVLLGFQYYLEICRDDELAERVMGAMRRHADYLMTKIGKGEGKVGINQTTHIWGGLNSSSILEPYVRLYNLTGDQRYLDFATYIVEEGGTSTQNIFKTAYEDELAPYQYDHVKAYEMMSCFEGLIEYARVTGSEYYREAAIRFGYRLLKTDVTVIGCCGTNHELFDHSTKAQTRAVDDVVMQETCVTVTWMKLLSQLLRLTGDPVFADAMEQSFCNAYLGALNTRGVIREWDARPSFLQTGSFEPSFVMMPFDSYSPLRTDRRCRKVAGLCNFSEDNTYYGCCSAIGAAGIGIMGRTALTRGAEGLTLQYYTGGRVRIPEGEGETVLCVETDYPYAMTVRVTVERWETDGKLWLRVPAWSKRSELTQNGGALSCEPGYVSLSVKAGDIVELSLDDRVRQLLPPCSDSPDAAFLGAYAYGPVLLAADARLGQEAREGICVVTDAEGFVPYERVTEPFAEIRDARLSIILKTERGHARLVDYSSAGKTFTSDSECAVWLKRQDSKTDHISVKKDH